MSRKNVNSSVARFSPLLRESWQFDILDILYEIWFFYECWQLIWLKINIMSQANIIWAKKNTSCRLDSTWSHWFTIFKLFTSACGRDGWALLYSWSYALNYMNKPEWNSLLSWGLEFSWVKFYLHFLTTSWTLAQFLETVHPTKMERSQVEEILFVIMWINRWSFSKEDILRIY